MVKLKSNVGKKSQVYAGIKRGLSLFVRRIIFGSSISGSVSSSPTSSFSSSSSVIGSLFDAGASKCSANDGLVVGALNKLTDKEKTAFSDYLVNNLCMYDTVLRAQTLFNGPGSESVTGRTSFYLATLLHRDMMRADLLNMLEQITGTRDYGVKYNETAIKKWKIILRMILLYRSCPAEYPYMNFNQVAELLGGSRGTAGMVQEFLLAYNILERNPLHKGYYFLKHENRMLFDKYLTKIERKYSAFTIEQINHFGDEND